MSSDTTSFIDQNNGIMTSDFNRWRYVERFLQRPALVATSAVPAGDTYDTSDMQAALQANRNWAIAGTNAADAGVTYVDGGGVLLTTTTTSGDQVILIPQSATNMSSLGTVKWNTSDVPGVGGIVKTGASIASVIYWFGLKLTNTSVVATDDNQAFFRYEAGVDTNWQFCWSTAGVDYSADTQIPVVAATQYSFWIWIDADLQPRFAIASGTLNPDEIVPGMLTTQYMTANIDLKPYVGVQTATAGAKTLVTRIIGLSKNYND